MSVEPRANYVRAQQLACCNAAAEYEHVEPVQF